MNRTLGIINGPNLNLLGKREPEVYGSHTFEAFLEELKVQFPERTIEYFQSNEEGALIDCVQEWGFSFHGIVLNAGGYSHTSVALSDAVRAIPAPVVEVHISNTFSRESYRHHSYLSPVAAGIIVGMGLKGYGLALEYLLSLNTPPAP